MKKKGPVQLSFLNSLLKDEKRETVFIDTALDHFKSCKWLRMRIRYCNATREEKLLCQTHLSDALDYASALLYKVSRHTKKYRDYTEEDFMKILFIDKDYLNMTSSPTMKELRSHHAQLEAGVIGMFLAYKDILKKHKEKVTQISDSITTSSRLLQRLDKNVV